MIDFFESLGGAFVWVVAMGGCVFLYMLGRSKR